MEMSTDYLRQTVAWMEARGFSAQTASDAPDRDGTVLFSRDRWTMQRGADQAFTLEALRYPDGTERWFLAIDRFHGLTSTSYPLDSWKHRADKVEFKYQLDPETGTALTFVLWASEPE